MRVFFLTRLLDFSFYLFNIFRVLESALSATGRNQKICLTQKAFFEQNDWSSSAIIFSKSIIDEIVYLTVHQVSIFKKVLNGIAVFFKNSKYRVVVIAGNNLASERMVGQSCNRLIVV